MAQKYSKRELIHSDIKQPRKSGISTFTKGDKLHCGLFDIAEIQPHKADNILKKRLIDLPS